MNKGEVWGAVRLFETKHGMRFHKGVIETVSISPLNNRVLHTPYDNFNMLILL